MPDRELKALAIDSKTAPPAIGEYKWNVIPTIENFTRDIKIPNIVNIENVDAADLGPIVSGVPTVYARAILFKNAIEIMASSPGKAEGLTIYYDSLVSEWRGLIACIALNYKDLEVNRVLLQYSDKKNIIETSNIYEPVGAFGNMLFDRKLLWCDQTPNSNEEKIPFLDIITLDGQVIGSTSPESLLFTAVGYKIEQKEERLPFVSVNKKRLVDPLSSELKFDDLLKLHAYVKNIINKINVFSDKYNNLGDLKPNYRAISTNLSNWLKEMDNYAEKRGWIKPSQKSGSIPEVSNFQLPFSDLFNYSSVLYGEEGVIFEESGENRTPFKPSELLLDREKTKIVQFFLEEEAVHDEHYLAKKPIFLLRATRKGNSKEFHYFTLPLTSQALNVFGKNLASLTGVNEQGAVKSRLTAEYEFDELGRQYLSVKLRLFTDKGVENEINVKYSVDDNLVKGRDILIWPNFISKKWNKYYMYNEIPHNDGTIRATPFVGNLQDVNFKIISDKRNGEPHYLSTNGKISQSLPDSIRAKLVVETNTSVSDNIYKYEIYESNQPFKGVKFSFGSNEENLSGFIIIRYDKIGRIKELPHDWTDRENELYEANIGLDFGSTNTSVAYYSNRDNETKEIEFENRRVSLLLSDEKNNNEQSAEENEVFFFQNDKVKSNSIRSVLAIHDHKRVSNPLGETQIELFSRAVSGGFPCFEKNLPIEKSTRDTHILDFNRAGIAELRYNMKWSSDEIQKSYRKAYLNSLMLHVYAQLFVEEHKPTSIRWSYPSSMGSNLVHEYNAIFNTLANTSPIIGTERIKVSQARARGNSNIYTDVKSNNSEEVNGVSLEDAWGSRGGNRENISSINLGIDETKFFDFVEANDESSSMTEATAVANFFLRNKNVGIDRGKLLIIIDIGGSTSDISVLTQIDKKFSGNAMIKQNSIRWAAQRLSHSTSISKNIESVLRTVCNEKGFRIQGLNLGESKYNENTAPFYFEQLLDRLKDSDFEDFYRRIAAECKELMSVNLYITGLIMYYAGQITLKLTDQMSSRDDLFEKMPNTGRVVPKVQIAFAGKGARMFDWFKAVDKIQANEYYTNMFISGMGGMEVARQTIMPFNYPNEIIKMNNSDSSFTANIKYEVSKGLAYPAQNNNQDKVYLPKSTEAIEILGEDGFCVYLPNEENKEIRLDYKSAVTKDMMKYLGSHFVQRPDFTTPCPRFKDFCDIFQRAARVNFGFDMSNDEYIDGFNNMNIAAFIKAQPDYIEACKNEEFDYVAPIFIMEGIKFFETKILRHISKR